MLTLCLLLSLLQIAVAQRNAAAEEVCQSFLVSPSTSPLVRAIKRNLTIDEDGEFECEVVLQDRFLPAQIRLTIHEGLFFLSMRHIEQGHDKHREIVRHARILREMLPRSKKFAVYVGKWTASPHIGEFSEALTSLECAFTGDCTEYAELDPAEEYAARRLLARLLSYYERDEEAYAQLIAAGHASRTDFALAFALEELTVRAGINQQSNEKKLLVARTASSYNRVSSIATNAYNGFLLSAGKDWAPRLLQQCTGEHPPADDTAWLAEELTKHINLREPLIIRPCIPVSDTFSLLVGATAETAQNTKFRVDRIPVSVHSRHSFGAHTGQLRKMETLSDFLLSPHHGGSKNDSVKYLEFLTSRDNAALDGAQPNALQRLYSSTPLSKFINKTALSHVSSWIGRGAPAIQQQLQTDPFDILITSLNRNMTCRLFSPDSALHMKTVYPTYAVAPNGVTFQYVPPDGNNFYDDIDIMRMSSRNLDELEHQLPNVIVNLAIRDILLIPAGWFREITFLSNDATAMNDEISIAVTYHLEPPDLKEAAAFAKEARDRLSQQMSDLAEKSARHSVLKSKIDL